MTPIDGLLPDIIAMVRERLTTDPAVTALVATAQIRTEFSGDQTWPAVRLDLIGGTEPLSGWIVRQRVQVTCAATSELAAHTLARHISRSLRAARSVTAGVWVSAETSAPQSLVDPDRVPPVHLVAVGAVITAHPNP